MTDTKWQRDVKGQEEFDLPLYSGIRTCQNLTFKYSYRGSAKNGFSDFFKLDKYADNSYPKKADQP